MVAPGSHEPRVDMQNLWWIRHRNVGLVSSDRSGDVAMRCSWKDFVVVEGLVKVDITVMEVLRSKAKIPFSVSSRN